MRRSRTIDIVSAHAEGEVGRVVTGGVLDVPGRSMEEKLRHMDTPHPEPGPSAAQISPQRLLGRDTRAASGRGA